MTPRNLNQSYDCSQRELKCAQISCLQHVSWAHSK